MFLGILCTFLIRKLLLENLSENRLLLPLAKKCCFSRIFMRQNKVYDGIVVPSKHVLWLLGRL